MPISKNRRTSNAKRSSRSSTQENSNKKRKTKNESKDEYINLSDIPKEDSMNSFDEQSNSNLLEDNSKQSLDGITENLESQLTSDIKKSKLKGNVKKYTKSSKKEDQSDSETVDESQIKKVKNEIDILRENLLALRSFKKAMMENNNKIKVLENVMNDILEEVCFGIFQEVTQKIKLNEVNIYEKTSYGVLPNEKSLLDIFENDYTNYTPQSFQCDNGCGRTISSNRYAPHLEKCAGLSSRNLPRSSRRRSDKVKYEDVYSELDSQFDLE